jgi:hypothetical protein
MREEFGDIMRLILETAPHDKAAWKPGDRDDPLSPGRLCRPSF